MINFIKFLIHYFPEFRISTADSFFDYLLVHKVVINSEVRKLDIQNYPAKYLSQDFYKSVRKIARPLNYFFSVVRNVGPEFCDPFSIFPFVFGDVPRDRKTNFKKFNLLLSLSPIPNPKRNLRFL